MRRFLNSIAKPGKRSYWRSVFAGLLCHYLAVALLLSTVILLRPFVWAALYGMPYQSPPGPVDPGSDEGTLLQVIGLLSWVPAGAAALHWSPNRSKSGVFTLGAYVLGLLILGLAFGFQPPMSLARTSWYWLSAPIGIAVGAVTYSWYANKREITSAV